MKPYESCTREELMDKKAKLQRKYEQLCGKNLTLNMARGKPSSAQLDLSNPMLDTISSKDLIRSESGVDVRNYGGLEGIPEAREFFASILQVKPEQVIVGGNSSLNLMYDTLQRCMQYGVLGSTPWNKLDKVKFLCPSPGYDRHFTVCQTLGIEMIPVEMTENGPNMDQVEELVSDEEVKGIWCVPKYSNPTGITYSDEVVKRFAKLKPAASDFRIFWDNAYAVHHLYDKPAHILNIFDLCKENGNSSLVYAFASTSKITFPGAGISAIASSEENIQAILETMKGQTIGHDKMNQLRHILFLGTEEKLTNHMKKHANIIRPKFEMVLDCFEKEIAPLKIGSWSHPMGGYFISFNTLPGCASRVYQLCSECGVVMTTAGATYPYGNDPEDSNIRIAPTYPPLDELKEAIEVFCLCVKLASCEKILKELRI